MSDKKIAANEAAGHLRNAKSSLASAASSAAKTGDAKLTAAVTKLSQETARKHE